MPIKDALEMPVTIFDRSGTQLVKDAPDFTPVIGMGIASILGGHEQSVGLLAGLVQIGRIVMAVA